MFPHQITIRSSSISSTLQLALFKQERVPRINHVMTEHFLTYYCVFKQHYRNDLWHFWPLDPNIER